MTMTKATAILRDLIDHAKDFAAESAQEGRTTDAHLWRTQADALLSLMETHRLVPVDVADQCLRVAELLADEGVVAVGPISPAFREDFRKLAAALKEDAHGA